MIVECSNGEELDDQRVEVFACHHCGTPVCLKHGRLIRADDAFAEVVAARSPLPEGSAPLAGLLAGVPVVGNATARLGRSTRPSPPAPQPAMHCQECYESYHKNAARLTVWPDAAVSQP